MDHRKRVTFMSELQTLINRHSIENESNTPDFLLAEYLLGCLSIYEHTVVKRDQWYGQTPRINHETSPRKT